MLKATEEIRVRLQTSFFDSLPTDLCTTGYTLEKSGIFGAVHLSLGGYKAPRKPSLTVQGHSPVPTFIFIRGATITPPWLEANCLCSLVRSQCLKARLKL